MTRGVDELSTLFNLLGPKLDGIGLRPEERGFSPHITLARVRTGKNREKLMHEIMGRVDEDFGNMKVKHIRLKKSVLTPNGPIYTILAESKN